MKKIATLMLMILLSGCSFNHVPNIDDRNYAETVFNEEVFAKGNKGVVILQGYNNIPSDYAIYNYFLFEDKHNDQIHRWFIHNSAQKVVMLSPGKYNLAYYYLRGTYTSGQTTYTTHLDFDGQFDASFEVKAGDVIYLGRVKNVSLVQDTSSWLQGKKSTAKSDVFVEDDFGNLDPELVSLIESKTGKKIQKRLINWQKTATAVRK